MTNVVQSVSPWMETTIAPAHSPLTKSTTTDVCVVGGGIVGITTAYLLAREGQSVIVLDSRDVGYGETARTTAHLSNANDNRYVEIERLHGEEGARLAAESHTAAIDRIEAIVAEEHLDCGFSRLDGYLFEPPGESTDLLSRELQAAHRAGLTTVYQLERSVLPSFDTGPSLCFPRQAVIEPLAYLKALAEIIKARGGRIFSNAQVTAVQGGSSARVDTAGGATVSAGAVVVATNTPVNDRFAIHTKQAAYRTYVVAVRVPRGSVPHALFWDTANPYHYVRLLEARHNGREGDLLLVGGEDHKTGQADDADDRYTRLMEWARERFEGSGPVEYRWSGQILETIDGLAFIGVNPLDAENVFVATGDSGHGMTHGTIAGILLTELILGRSNPWAKLYDPGRKTLRAAWDFARENLNVVARYADYILGETLDSADTIPPGEGGIVRQGLKYLAVYRDPDGFLHEHSAICPHLGCIVQWNSAEHTWDCPCHGSRFDARGGVLQGPAVGPLAEIGEVVAHHS